VPPIRVWPILTFALRSEADVVLARQRARQISALLGLHALQQTRLATAVSEIARNALTHGGGGKVQYALDAEDGSASLRVRVTDRGRGITDVADALDGSPRLSIHGNAGLAVAQRLVDRFAIESSTAGTTITLGVLLGARQVTAADANRVAADLASRPAETLMEELHRQHQELLGVLEDLTVRQEQLTRLNAELEETNRGVLALYHEVAQELEDTNRGVLALYAELDERANQLRRANYVKNQFITYLSHEFRTPLYSTQALLRFLLDPAQGELPEEKGVQVRLIQRSTEDLLELVSDLLDLAKHEAGKLEIRAESVTVPDLFSALRGMLRPLAATGPVTLSFEADPALPPLHTDSGRLSQVLRNLIANALKFTDAGEVRVTARPDGADAVLFQVQDTGIGIAPEQQERIFEDFAQAGGAFQGRVRGTGLGLALSRRLTALLGGSISVESEPGVGSTFSVRVPIRYSPPAQPSSRRAPPEAATPVQSARQGRVLLIEDQEATRYVIRETLRKAGQESIEAADGAQGLELARERAPDLIFLDLRMPGMSGFEVLDRLKEEPATRGIPVLIYSGEEITPEDLERLHGRVAGIISKAELMGPDAEASLAAILARHSR
jgi:signal transduction histidine kinase/CheY-like chemotaxis protein